MVGVVYLSADPNSSPYVKVGQHVKAGDTLLLIEAMKTFNEIKAPRSGIIKKIEVLEYPELGMEAVWKIEVKNFPAFVVIDNKGNDFFDF